MTSNAQPRQAGLDLDGLLCSHGVNMTTHCQKCVDYLEECHRKRERTFNETQKPDDFVLKRVKYCPFCDQECE
jgi:hypothetical protein